MPELKVEGLRIKGFWLLVVALVLLPVSCFALSVTSDAPCNVFVAGKAIDFQVKDAQGSVKWELVDYWGNKTAEGTAVVQDRIGKIRIVAQKPCWYELKCKDDKGEKSVSLGVVLDRKNAPLPVEGRIGSVACSAWLVKNEAYRVPIARMLRLIGMSWVREPLAWEATEKEPGKFEWNVYQTVSDSLTAEGVYINHGWTSVPAWSHPGNPGQPYPDDLRTLYKYLKTASSHYSKYSLTWDVLNEVELAWPILSDSCAGMQKASYLGIKAGNPKARVLLSSFSHITAQSLNDWGISGFMQGMYDNGVGDYFDILNHHSYLPPWSLASDVEGHKKMMQKYGVKGKQFWLTEAGLGFNGTDGPAEHYMNAYAEKQQCRLVPMSAAASLAAGDEKYFWFCLPDYIENGSVQFAMLRPDISPNPSLISISACTNIIGVSDYAGEFNADGRKSVSYLFKTTKGNVLVAWSNKDTEISVPTEKPSVKVADMFGAVSTVAAKDGAVRVKVGQNSVYLLNVGEKITASKSFKKAATLTPALDPLDHSPASSLGERVHTPSTVVLVGKADLPMDRGFDAYKVSTGAVAVAGTPFNYTVDVYQFDEKKAATGTIELVAPDKWIVENPKRTVKLSPMGRQTVTFKITPVASFLGNRNVVVRGNFNGKPTSPAAARVRYDFNAYAY